MAQVVTEQMLLFSGATTFGDATTLHHGLLPKLSGAVTQVLRGDGTFGSAGGTGTGVSEKLYDYEVVGADKASIDTFVDGATVANFTGFDVLEIWFYARTDEAVGRSPVSVIFNNDTGNNYDRHGLFGQNVTVSASVIAAQPAAQLLVAGATCTAGIFGVTRVSLPFFSGTVGNKTWENWSVVVDQVAANTQTESRNWNWRSNSAITRVKFFPETVGKKFKVGTRVIVYGR